VNRKSRTCLDCGLVTIQDAELTLADRVMLGTRGQSAVMPSHPERTCCYQKRWVDYDLTYSIADSLEGVFDELEASRDKCAGFIEYLPGSTPQQQLDKQERLRRERVQRRIAALGFLGGLIGALIGSILPKLMSWLLH